MIPVLYESNEKEFTSNGIGKLSNAASCTVKEERNGRYELKMKYPVTGSFYKELTKLSNIIMADTNEERKAQPFRIYRTTKPINGIITIYAEHISYQMSHIPVAPFTAGDVSEALEGIASHASEENPFTFWTDKQTVALFSVDTPSSIRSRLGGNDGSILDVYGGEYEFDRYMVKLHESRGADNGVRISYGKNLTDINQEESIQSTITGVYPYWQSMDEYVELPERALHSTNVDNYPFPRTIPLDCTMNFDEKPTVEQLRAFASGYINQSGIGVPKVNIKISFIALWQTEEYKNIAPLERVRLCDTVTVTFTELGVDAKAKVISTEYNVLLDRYDSIELGESRTRLEDNIIEQGKDIENKGKELAKKPSVGDIQGIVDGAVNGATDWINGANGGYVVMHKNANGQPYEILIMDTTDIATAQNVWRWNQNGWGHSSTGYNGQYAMAATIDGGMVADYITAGTLQGVKIIAELGKIGGWTISNSSIYKDVTTSDGKIYRAKLAPPLPNTPDKSWILSCQESTDGGQKFYGNFVLYSDGSAYFCGTQINSDGSIKLGNTTISKNGTITLTNGARKIELTPNSLMFLLNNIEKASFAFYGDGGSNDLSVLKVNNLWADKINGYVGYTGNVYFSPAGGGSGRLEIVNGIVVNVYT